MFMEGVGIEQLFSTLISVLGSGSEGFSVTFTALGCLSIGALEAVLVFVAKLFNFRDGDQ